MTLPVELYREIAQHLSPQELAPLLLCNRFVRLEAARLIFQNIDLRSHKNVGDARIISFQHICQGVGAYVHRLEIFIVDRYMTIMPQIFLSLPNLKELFIRWQYVSSSFHRFMPRNPPFKLTTLVIRHTPCSAMTRFVQSQRLSLRRFDNEHDSDFNFPFEFPMLRVLGANSRYATGILEKGMIKCLKCVAIIRRYNLREPALSVRSLELSYFDVDLSTLPTLFPNVLYIQQIILNGFEHFTDRYPPLASLEKLRLMIPPLYTKTPFDSSAYRNRVIPLFEKFPKLRFVYVTATSTLGPAPDSHSWVYSRDSEPLFIVEDYGKAADEWARYEDDRYQTTI